MIHNETQIKTVPMKEKIKALFKEYYNDETMPAIELEDKVLALFDVVGQSEQLVCEYCNEDAKPTCCDSCLGFMVNAGQKAN